MFSIRQNYYYYLYIQWKTGLLLYFIFNKNIIKRAWPQGREKGKVHNFFFWIKRHNFLQWKTLGDSLFYYVFYVKHDIYIYIDRQIDRQIIQKKIHREMGNEGMGRQDLQYQHVQKCLTFVSTSQTYVKHAIFYILFIIRLIPRG